MKLIDTIIGYRLAWLVAQGQETENSVREGRPAAHATVRDIIDRRQTMPDGTHIGLASMLQAVVFALCLGEMLSHWQLSTRHYFHLFILILTLFLVIIIPLRKRVQEGKMVGVVTFKYAFLLNGLFCMLATSLLWSALGAGQTREAIPVGYAWLMLVLCRWIMNGRPFATWVLYWQHQRLKAAL